jgi:hypothetical protein
MRRKAILRALAGGAGVFLVPPLVWLACWLQLIVLVAAQTPDPAEPDGDPCCSRPDTWAETAKWIGYAHLAALAFALGVTLAVALVAWAARGRGVRPRRLALIPAVLAAATTVSCAVLLAYEPLLGG